MQMAAGWDPLLDANPFVQTSGALLYSKCIIHVFVGLRQSYFAVHEQIIAWSVTEPLYAICSVKVSPPCSFPA